MRFDEILDLTAGFFFQLYKQSTRLAVGNFASLKYLTQLAKIRVSTKSSISYVAMSKLCLAVVVDFLFSFYINYLIG